MDIECGVDVYRKGHAVVMTIVGSAVVNMGCGTAACGKNAATGQLYLGGSPRGKDMPIGEEPLRLGDGKADANGCSC